MSDELTRLRNALAEAVESLDLAIGDCILSALAARRMIPKCKDQEGDCRWCGSVGDAHHEGCPVTVLVGVVYTGLLGDDIERAAMREFIENEDKRHQEKRNV